MTQDIEKYVEEFYSKWTHDQLGSYADHAPAYTHPEGECTICPVQVWYQDDIAYFLRTTLTKVVEEARREGFNDGRRAAFETIPNPNYSQQAVDEEVAKAVKAERERIVKLLKRHKPTLIDCNVGWKHKNELDDLIAHLSEKQTEI